MAPVGPFLHFVLRAGRDDGLAYTQFPTPAQGLVQGNQIRGNGGARIGQACFFLQQDAFRVDHALIIHGAFLILYPGDLHRPLGRCDGVLLKHQSFLVLEKPDQRIFHFLGGPEHGVLVVDEQLLEPRILDAHVVLDAAVIENGPPESSGRRNRRDCPVKQIVQVRIVGQRPTLAAALEPDLTEKRKAGIEIRFGHANAGTLGGGIQLGTADIGTPAQQFRRHAHGHFCRGRRNPFGSLQRVPGRCRGVVLTACSRRFAPAAD